MHEQLREGFQAQMQAEFESAYLYLAMASYCAHQGWMGCAHWLRIQWQEELGHALKFFEFLLDRGVQPELRALQQPAHAFGTPLELFTKVLEHEQYITGRIHRLYRQATELEDYPAQVFLQWFVDEQLEEESQARAIVEQLRQIGESPVGIYLLDRELARRKAEED
jgi:ferritin